MSSHLFETRFRLSSPTQKRVRLDALRSIGSIQTQKRLNPCLDAIEDTTRGIIGGHSSQAIASDPGILLVGTSPQPSCLVFLAVTWVVPSPEARGLGAVNTCSKPK